MRATSALTFFAGAASATALALLIASGPEHDPHGNLTQDEVDQMMEMSPEDMMAAMAKISTPNEHHQELGKMVGNWTAAASFIMDPTAPPTEGTGSLSLKWELGGRFLRGDFKMDFMGQPFHGISFTGYDIAHEQYVSTWMDTMSTKITYMEGNQDEAGALVMKGTATTPMGDNPMKIVTTHQDDDTFTDKFYDQMPDGTWFNSGTIVYTRK